MLGSVRRGMGAALRLQGLAAVRTPRGPARRRLTTAAEPSVHALLFDFDGTMVHSGMWR